ncbi:MAG: amino acid racemase [Candidatus Aminicenantes bacterium]|nr:amino acid racemase [Candidatus Aminicenantes bacterium]
MADRKKKTIGILGGMGPEATAFMYNLFIREAKAEKDQDHPQIIIFSNPQTPPRTDAIFKSEKDPVPFLKAGMSVLKKAGADFIVMPCITAHYFIPDLKKEIPFNFISLIEESVKWAEYNNPGMRKAGLLSSSGTMKSGLFHAAFEKKGIELITPDKREQQRMMEVIFGPKGIKAGFKTSSSRKQLIQTAESLIKRGAEAIIAGCTEIPLALSPDDIQVLYIEPMHIAVLRALQEAGYQTKKSFKGDSK